MKVIHADVRRLRLEALDGFDALITDPPYATKVHEDAMSLGVEGAPVDRDLGFDPLDYELREVLAYAASRVKRWSLIYSDLETLGEWIAAYENEKAEHVRVMPWIRWSQPSMNGDRPPQGAEAVLVAHARTIGARGGAKPKAKRWNGPGSAVFFDARCMRGKEKHPTEKPLDLLLDQVSWFTDPGEHVLDLCAGSGTTGVACRILGREFTGYELNQEWAEKADRRLRGTFSPRDRDRAKEWIERTSEEALRALQAKYDGENARRRANARLDDCERVEKAIA